MRCTYKLRAVIAWHSFNAVFNFFDGSSGCFIGKYATAGGDLSRIKWFKILGYFFLNTFQLL